MKTDLLSRKADYIGITGSVLCIIHCLVTPVLLMTTAVLHDEHLRIGYLSLDYAFIGVNITAVYFATKSALSPVIRKALWGFLVLFAIGILLEDVGPAFPLIGYAASAGLVMTHLVNIRQHRLQHAQADVSMMPNPASPFKTEVLAGCWPVGKHQPTSPVPRTFSRPSFTAGKARTNRIAGAVGKKTINWPTI